MRQFIDRLRDQAPTPDPVPIDYKPGDVIRGGQSRAFMVERVVAGTDRRQFVFDCPHGTTELYVDDFKRDDAGRSSGIWDRLIAQHRVTIATLEKGWKCECLPDRPLRS